MMRRRTVIRTVARLSYGDAQKMIDGEEITPETMHGCVSHPSVIPEVAKDVNNLNEIGTALRAARFASGSLELHSVELRFKTDERNHPISVGPYQIKKSNNLIEEFMLLANQSVARRIHKAFPTAALLR
jgi:exoribonuclease R